MHAALSTYFDGEKTAGLMLAAIGLAVLAGAALIFPARWDLRPLAWTLLVCGAVEVVVGLGLHLKTPPQVARLEARLTNDAAGFYVAETPRMERVQKAFVVIELVWLVLIVGGAIAAVWLKERATVHGIALGLLVNAGALLAFDLTAERRGAVYLSALRTHSAGETGSGR